MAITDKEQGVWILDEVYNKQNQGGIWSYDGIPAWFTMGKGEYGDLGLNASAPSGGSRSSPTQLPGTTWSRISSSGGRGFRGLKTDGTAWAWGYNNVGQLGINIGQPAYAVGDRSSPTQIGADNTWSSKFTSDDASTFWIKTDGTLWSWGYNPSGELGLNEHSIGYPFPSRSGMYSSPTQVGSDATWSDVIAAAGTTYATKTNGSLWSWGNGRGGNLGDNESGPTHRISSPAQVGTGTDWSKLAGSSSGAAFAIKTDGTTWSWGYDQYGKLGLNEAGGHRSSPTQLPGTWNNFTKAYSHVIATKTDGTLWSWGYNPFGNLGLNDRGAGGSTSRSSPTQVPGTTWSQVAAGYLTSMATKTDGTLWTWGENEAGQMGQNTPGSPSAGAISSPTQVGTDTGWSDPAGSREEFFAQRML